MKLKLSNINVQRINDMWEGSAEVGTCIARAIELAEVVDDEPTTAPEEPAPEPTPAGDTVRDFDVWWKQYVTAFPQTRGDESSAWHAWIAATEATTKRLSK